MRIPQSIVLYGLGLSAVLAGGVPLEAATYYVAPGGDDASSTPTNIETPFRTIQQAALLAGPGDSVLIRGGVYRETVVPAYSGEPDSPITFRSYEDEDVTVSGCEDVLDMTDETRWQVWKSNVMGTDDAIYVLNNVDWNLQTTTNQAHQLFFNGKMMLVARHPNPPVPADLDPMSKSWFSFDDVDVKIEQLSDSWESGKWSYRIADEDIANLPDFEGNPVHLSGMTIWFQPRHVGAERWGHTASGTITDYDPGAGEITYFASGFQDGIQIDNPYYVGNGLGVLDMPGEWYYDAGRRQLYFYPPDGEDPTDDLVEGKVRDYAFQLHDGGLTDGFRNYITIQDLAIFGSLVTTDTYATDGTGNGNAFRGRTTGDPLEQPHAESYGVSLNNLHFKYISHATDGTGHSHGQWWQTGGITLSGFGHSMRNCIIEYSSNHGIVVIGGKTIVENNLIHDTGYHGFYSAAINVLGDTHDVTVRKNTIWRTGDNGIRNNENKNTNDPDYPAEVAYNRIQSYGMLTEDVGGIKTVGHSDDVNYSAWHHNILSHGNADDIALYQDFTTRFAVHHNITCDVFRAMNINNGMGHLIYNNTLLAYDPAGQGMGGSEGDGNDIRNNILGSADEESIFIDAYTFAANLVGPDMSIFVNPEAGNLHLVAPVSPAAVDIPDQYEDPQVGPNREIGALEFEGVDWTAEVGSNLPLLWETPSNLQVARNSSKEVVLTWNDNADNETAYFVERGISRVDGDRLFEVVAKLPANSTTWVDPFGAVSFNQPLYYRVRANHSMYANTATMPPVGKGLGLLFDGNLEDTAFNENNGNILKGDTAGTAVFSPDSVQGSHSIEFEADATLRVEVPHDREISPARELTVMFWMKPASWTENVTFFEKENSFRLSMLFGSARLKLGTGGTTPLFGPEEIELNEWTHLAMTYSGFRTKAYLDGVLVVDNPNTPRNLEGDADLFIGGPASGIEDPSRYFDGMIDDFSIYHTALSEKEIQQAMRTSMNDVILIPHEWKLTPLGYVFGVDLNWGYSPFMGNLYLSLPWLYHLHHGWMISFSPDPDEESRWLYSMAMGWIWVHKDHDGWYYQLKEGKWRNFFNPEA